MGVLVPDAVADFAVDEGVELAYFDAAHGEAFLGWGRQGGDDPGAVAVGFDQVLGDVGFDAEVLDQVDEEGFGEAVGADEADLVRLAAAVEGRAVVDELGAADAWGVEQGGGGEVVELEGGVDGFFSHLPVGGPFTAGDGEEA